jgi:hypothetical protein
MTRRALQAYRFGGHKHRIAGPGRDARGPVIRVDLFMQLIK